MVDSFSLLSRVELLVAVSLKRRQRQRAPLSASPKRIVHRAVTAGKGAPAVLTIVIDDLRRVVGAR